MNALESAKHSIVQHSRIKFGTKPRYGGIRCYVKVCATREYTNYAAGDGGGDFFQYIKDTEEHWLDLSEHLGGELVFSGEWLDPATFPKDHPLKALREPLFVIHHVCIDLNCIFDPELIEKIAPDLDQVLAVNWIDEPDYYDSLERLEASLSVKGHAVRSQSVTNDTLGVVFAAKNAVRGMVIYPGTTVAREILVNTKIEVDARGAYL